MVSMQDCICRVPKCMKGILENWEQNFSGLEKAFGSRLNAVDEIVLIGSGTSNTSAVTARFPMQRLAGVRVTPVVPSEFVHEEAVRNANALYVFLSQTGTSALTRDALAEARGLGCMTAAMSESPNTPAAREADAFLDMGCGMEEYPMRTIGYSTSVLTLMLLGLWLGARRGSLSEERKERFLAGCARTAQRMPDVIDHTLRWLEKERRQMLRSDCLVFTGSGALAGVAMEAAVKMWETPQIVTLSYELEEGLHAPNYGYTQRHCVIALNDGGVDNDKARALAAFMKNEKQNGFIIGANPLDEHDLAIEVESDADCLLFAAVVQTMACQLAIAQGRDLFAPHDNRVMYSYFDTHNELKSAQKGAKV